MDYKQAARSHEFNKKHGSISSLINKSTIDSFEAGYEFCKNEYEEKLRWIPVEERLPEIYNCQISVKKQDSKYADLRFFINSFQFETICKIHGYTEWRFFL